MPYTSVLWDLDDDPAGNVMHLAEHGVTPEEVEDVLGDPVDADTSRSTGYPVVFGYTRTDRHLIVVFEEVDAHTAYPITAYDVPERGSS